ncbi:MAG: hypothetical protein K8S23_06590 [Candidatus Cloacimonetes bacterium]|nr:hypothetical protein [Candidatus Cloacimonadota bacterium]
MNILTFNLSERSTEIIDIFSQIKGISMYFAISADDILKKATEIKPDIILLGENTIPKNIISKTIPLLFPQTKIYQFKRI